MQENEALARYVTVVAQGNMKDEKTLSEVIDTLSMMTGKKVNSELKDKIIKKVVNDDVPKNVDKMF